MEDEHGVLKEQQAYYRARAPEYDEWFQRLGRYDEGPESNRLWFAEVEEVRQALTLFGPRGDVLELASGTGWWTNELLKFADRVTAVDGSAEVLALNRERLGADARVRHVQSDIFAWVPDRSYDVVFFSFWLSHVPPGHFVAFWDRVRSALRSDGRVFFMDSLQRSVQPPHAGSTLETDSQVAIRRLGDGREFRVVKIFYRPQILEQDLRALHWRAIVKQTPTFFLYGSADPL